MLEAQGPFVPSAASGNGDAAPAGGGGEQNATSASGDEGADSAGTEDAARALAERLGEAVGVEFHDIGLAVTSLTHRSYAFERGLTVTNERLEFLGDAVLGVVVTDLAFREFPDLPEGELAKLRAATVNMTSLADVAADRALGDLVLLGRGEELSGGRGKASILADAMEAVLGAVYLDRGLDVATELIVRLFNPRMEAYARGEGERDYKTVLQELSAQEVGSVPDYRVAARGPDHQKEFTATVYLAGQPWGQGTGRSKKEAEQQAAREAYARIQAGDRPETSARRGG
ncbi:MAG TPA: ribonuclease III [Actinomycetota bacterium]|jgi:ribonuclease-3